MPYAPRQQFVPFHERHERFAALVCHRRAGKTVASVNDLIRGAATCNRPNPRFAYIAPFYKQAKDIAWTYLKQGIGPLRQYGAETSEGELKVTLPNNGLVKLYGADNPDSLRGVYFDGIVLDEPAQMDPTLWPEIIRPALADREGWAVFVGTPKGRNSFYELWRQAQKSPDWFKMLLKASESGLLPAAELIAAREMMTEQQYRQEFECSFHEPDVAQYILNEEVDAAIERTRPLDTAPVVFGLDVARFGDDRTVLLVRVCNRVERVYSWREDTMQTAMRCGHLANEHKPSTIFIDGGGVGGGVVDRMKELGYRVVDVNSGSKASAAERYANRRAEMWARMKEWLRESGDIPNEPELVDDLLAPAYKFDASSRLLLEKKEDMKARGMPSPDFGDALALTFAAPTPHPDMQVLAVRFATTTKAKLGHAQRRRR